MAQFPKDWTVEPLSGLGEVLMCKRVLKSQTTPMGDIPFYKIGTFGKKADAFIPRDLFERFRKAYSYPKRGDVLVSAAGTIGRTVVFDGSESYFQDSNIVWLGNDERKVLNSYLYWWYQVVEWTTENGGIVTRLYNGSFRATAIVYPDISEQRRIVEALDSIDNLIDNLARRIKKKRMVKQGVMQDLLTGKKRLPGGRGHWEQTTLGTIIRFQKGQLLISKDYRNGSIPVIAGGQSPAGFHDIANRTGVTITISASGAYAGYVAKFEEPIFATDCTTIGESERYDVRFIYYWLKLHQKILYESQSGGAQPHVHARDLEPLSILIPEDITEQHAIAKVLAGMDAEIAVLEAKREKYERIKQGMMHDLLTGKVRI